MDILPICACYYDVNVKWQCYYVDNNNALLAGLPDYQISRLQRLQNTAARIVTLTKKHDHVTPVLENLHWLPVSHRITYKILLLTYKALNGLAPQYIKDLLIPYSAARNLRSTNQNLLTVPKSRLSTYGDRAFSVIAPALWNPLPSNIKSSETVFRFKSSLKTYLFKDAYSKWLFNDFISLF